MIHNDFDPYGSFLGRVGLVSTSLELMLFCCLIQHGILPVIFRLLTGEKKSLYTLGIHISQQHARKMKYYVLNTDDHSQNSAPVDILLFKRLKEMNNNNISQDFYCVLFK